MAKLGFKHTSEVQTRDKYTKCNFELGMTLDGRELPNAAVLGAALEDAVKLIQERITESYQVVPPRQEAPPQAVVTSNPAAAAAATAAHVQESTVPVRPNLGVQIAPDPVEVDKLRGLGFPPGYTPQQG